MINKFLFNGGVLLASLLLLDKFSHITIVNSERIAEITGFGKTAVGFILISLSTSLPELTVAVFSTTTEEAVGVALGNILGSNILNICLVFGACILYAALKNLVCIDFLPLITRDDIKTLQFGLFTASIVPLVLIYLGYASRIIGLVLVLLFLYNTIQLIQNREGVKEEGALGEEKEKLPRYVLMLFIGISGVIAASYFIVDAATFLALGIGVPKVVIGATVIALGTSLPELATSIQATKNNNIHLALANIVGSCFLNITLVLGITLMVVKFTINVEAFTNIAVFSLIATLFLWYFINGDQICWREGAILVFLYLLFLYSTLSF